MTHSGAACKADKTQHGRFSVETAWGRTFEFMVKNIGEAQEWVQVIKAAIAYWKVTDTSCTCGPRQPDSSGYRCLRWRFFPGA
jgi:hypothetical protein